MADIWRTLHEMELKRRYAEYARRWAAEYGEEGEYFPWSHPLKYYQLYLSSYHNPLPFPAPIHGTTQATLFEPFQPPPSSIQSESPKLEQITEIERLSARQKMLLSLVGIESLNERLNHLFPHKLEKMRCRISFEQAELATLGDFARFFGSIDRLYQLLLTVISKRYFTDRWLRGVIPVFAPDDLLRVEQIVKQSPGEMQVTGIGEVVRTLGDVLSVGNQVKDFKLAGVKVEEAKIELERKKREFDQEKRSDKLKEELSDLDLELERERKLLELEELRTKRDEEQRKRRRLMMEDIEQRFEILAKGIKVLAEVPEEVKAEFKAALFTELEGMHGTPLLVPKVELLAATE